MGTFFFVPENYRKVFCGFLKLCQNATEKKMLGILHDMDSTAVSKCALKSGRVYHWMDKSYISWIFVLVRWIVSIAYPGPSHVLNEVLWCSFERNGDLFLMSRTKYSMVLNWEKWWFFFLGMLHSSVLQMDVIQWLLWPFEIWVIEWEKILYVAASIGLTVSCLDDQVMTPHVLSIA